MPVYEYRCEDCKKLFSITETISTHEGKKGRPKCPQCGGKKTERVFSGFYAKTASKS